MYMRNSTRVAGLEEHNGQLMAWYLTCLFFRSKASSKALPLSPPIMTKVLFLKGLCSKSAYTETGVIAGLVATI